MVARSSALALARSDVALRKIAAPHPAAPDGDFPAIQFDMLHYRAVFPDRWTAMLRDHFRGAYHVQVFFGIDDKTARDWWNGKTAPTGAFVVRAVASIPGALKALMGDAA